MKKILVAAIATAVCVLSTIADAQPRYGGGGHYGPGWNNGGYRPNWNGGGNYYRPGWNGGGYYNGYYNNGWNSWGAFAAGAVVGGVIGAAAAYPTYAAPVYNTYPTTYIAPTTYVAPAPCTTYSVTRYPDGTTVTRQCY